MISRIKNIPQSNQLLDRLQHLKGTALGTLGFCTRWAVHADGTGPEWIDMVELDLHVRDVPHELHGVRIAHISDIHCSRFVSSAYLRRCIDRVNALEADIVVITGDYITYDFQGRFRTQAVELLGNVKSRLGTYACLGNHDYGVRTVPQYIRDRMLVTLINGMQQRGIRVLRNEAEKVDVDGNPLWLVGLGDLRAGDFRPGQAFSQVPPDEVTVVLLHNPRGIEYLAEYDAHAIVSGHTHGRGQSFLCPPSRKSRHYRPGWHEIEGKRLYVNRGLGRHGRTRFKAPPEITLFTLR